MQRACSSSRIFFAAGGATRLNLSGAAGTCCWPTDLQHHTTFGSRTFVPASWMCKKQNSVSHSSTESEGTSLDAGL